MDEETKTKLVEALKAHKLASFDELDKEFELTTIELGSSTVRSVRQKMIERVSAFASMLDEILYHPEPAHMYESRVFNESDRKNLVALHRKLHYLKRKSLECGIAREDSQDAAFIKDLVQQWPELKSELLSIAQKLTSSWEIELEKKDDVHYFA